MTFLDVIELLRKRLKIIIAVPVACALVAMLYAFLILPDTYTATTSVYVLTTNMVGESGDVGAELSASQMVTNDVATIMRSDRVTQDTLRALNMTSLDRYSIKVANENTTRVINLFVSGPDAEQTALIANTVAEKTSAVAQEVMSIQSVNVIDAAETPVYPSGPNRKLYVIIAFIIGLVAAIAVVIVMDMADTRVKSEDELQNLLNVPIIGKFPEIKGAR